VLWLLAAAVPFIVATIRCKPPDTSHAAIAPVRAAADVKQIMSGLIDPGADVVWESVGTVVTKASAEEHRPRTDAEWQVVRDAALQLTEGGNLLMLGDRAKDRETWWRMSRALVVARMVSCGVVSTTTILLGMSCSPHLPARFDRRPHTLLALAAARSPCRV
jgi:hypothetical protein